MMARQALSDMQLYTAQGQRLYVSQAERDRFVSALSDAAPGIRLLGLTLVWSGCRLSEALALDAARFDRGAGCLVIESLKKRRAGVFRAVPVPDVLFDDLQKYRNVARDNAPLFPMHRATAHRHLSALMRRAGVRGPQASAKGLRHGFGVSAIQAGVPLNLVQKWLGHASIRTTAIYANAVGEEERQIASLMWASAVRSCVQP